MSSSPEIDRAQLILAALTPGEGAEFSPVQVQKLLFLIDHRAGHLVGGRHFDFQPYNYGPFDKSVYQELRRLASEGLVEISQGRWQSYRLTNKGQTAGRAALQALDPRAADYIAKAVAFVRGLSFTELVSAIYKAFPEMRANSVFQG